MQLILIDILNSMCKETKTKYTFLAKFIQRQYFFALCKLNKNEVLYKHMEEGHFFVSCSLFEFVFLLNEAWKQDGCFLSFLIATF